MPVLPFVLGWLALVAAPTSAVAAGYRPSGGPIDLHDLGRLARLRDPDVKPFRFGTSDFEAHRGAGTTRRPAEDGGSVLAEVPGPGIVQHLWIARGGPRSNGNDRLRVYLDGRPEPALDLTLGELTAGRHPHFPKPLAGATPDGFVCDVPIAFRDGCRVVLDGAAPSSSQVSGVTLPSADGIATLLVEPRPTVRTDLDRARALWSHPEDVRNLGLADAEPAEYRIEVEARSTQVFSLPAGPRTIRSFEVVSARGTADAWRAARLRLTWEGDDPARAGVDLPLGDAFGPPARGAPSHSVLVGRDGESLYSHLPMPYRRQASLRLDSERPLAGAIRLLTVRGVVPDAGYFRAASRTDPAPESDGVFAWLDEAGRGHYVGVFLAGAAPRPGGVRLTVDGRPLGPEMLVVGDSDCGASASRWHPADPVPFVRSIAAGLARDHLPAASAGVRAAVFWYSEQPGPARAGR
ncbi:MAG TPA: DUF2961 domain-containing protein [Isosphaeraceae bacterium]|nr:DUF2961 domain-containing protein [Isosphaeraceae bacterium]